MFGRTGNPAFNRGVFEASQTWDDLGARLPSEPGRLPKIRVAPVAHMTLQGTINKSFFLLALCVTTALFGFEAYFRPGPWAGLCLVGGSLGGLLVGCIACMAPRSSVVTAPLYALLEGCFVGAVSAMYDSSFAGHTVGKMHVQLGHGLILNAVLITFGITASMLTLYSTKVLRPGRAFYNATFVGMVGLLFYGVIAALASMFFGAPSMMSVYNPSNGGLVSIGFSVLVLILGAANLVLDFDQINKGAENGAPKHLEWYGAFALMVTLIWLYLESLRLLYKLQKGRG